MKDLQSIFPRVSSILLRYDDFYAAIHEVLKVFGETLSVDRVYLFRTSKNEVGDLLLNYEVEWCGKGISPEINNEQLLLVEMSEFGALEQMFEEKRSLSAHVEFCPIPEVKPLLEMQDIQSYLWVRLQYKKEFLGFVGFDSCERKREWEDEEVKALEYLSDMVAHRMVRQGAEDKAFSLLQSLTRQNVFLKQVKEVQGKFLEQADSALVFNELLLQICEYCDALSGFIIHIYRNDSQEVNHELIAVSHSEWRTEIDDILDVLIKQNEEEFIWMHPSGNNEHVLNLYDQFDQHINIEESLGVDNFIALPIYFGKRLIGVLGLANFSNALSKKIIDDISWVVDICGSLLHGYRLEKERNKAKKDTKHQREAFERVFENTLSGFWDWNLKSNTEYLSPSFKQSLGYNTHELDDFPHSWLMLADDDDLKILFVNLNNHIMSKGELPFRQEVRFTHKQGHIVHILVGGCVMEWLEDGTPLRIVGCHVDVTDSAQLEERLRSNLEREKELGKLRSHLISMVSHQFRTPMSIILSNTELIGLKIDDKNRLNVVSNLNRIDKEMDTMNALMERVLSMEKLKHKTADIPTKLIDVIPLLEEIICDYNSLNPYAKVSRLHWPKDSIFAVGVEEDLRHIFSNLIANAYKYGGEKSPEIEIRYLADEVIVFVRDFGIGIPIADQQYVFLPFQRGRNVGKINGTGLGLSIVNELVKRQGGQIEFNSLENVKTEFIVRLKT